MRSRIHAHSNPIKLNPSGIMREIQLERTDIIKTFRELCYKNGEYFPTLEESNNNLADYEFIYDKDNKTITIHLAPNSTVSLCFDKKAYAVMREDDCLINKGCLFFITFKLDNLEFKGYLLHDPLPIVSLSQITPIITWLKNHINGMNDLFNKQMRDVKTSQITEQLIKTILCTSGIEDIETNFSQSSEGEVALEKNIAWRLKIQRLVNINNYEEDVNLFLGKIKEIPSVFFENSLFSEKICSMSLMRKEITNLQDYNKVEKGFLSQNNEKYPTLPDLLEPCEHDFLYNEYPEVCNTLDRLGYNYGKATIRSYSDKTNGKPVLWIQLCDDYCLGFYGKVKMLFGRVKDGKSGYEFIPTNMYNFLDRRIPFKLTPDAKEGGVKDAIRILELVAQYVSPDDISKHSEGDFEQYFSFYIFLNMLPEDYIVCFRDHIVLIVYFPIEGKRYKGLRFFFHPKKVIQSFEIAVLLSQHKSDLKKLFEIADTSNDYNFILEQFNI